MASKVKVTWNGDAIVGKIADAARAAIDETTAEADADASTSHAWANRTMQLEEEIVTEDAVLIGDRIVGRFGTTSRRGFYGLFHEEGTIHEFARPFLRPAADRIFPTLASKIRRRLER